MAATGGPHPMVDGDGRVERWRSVPGLQPIIAIEGTSGVGKTTLAAPLGARLGAVGFHFPPEFVRFRQEVGLDDGFPPIARLLYYTAGVAQLSDMVHAAAQDRYSADHLIDAAGDVVRHVARMQTRAEQEGTRLLTFTIDTEVSFRTPADFGEHAEAVSGGASCERERVHGF